MTARKQSTAQVTSLQYPSHSRNRSLSRYICSQC